MERTFLLLAAIPMAILLGLPSILPASFTLVGEKSDSASQLFLLKFEATEKDFPDSSMHNFDQLPEFRELGDPDWTPPAPSAGKTSALLAISGTREVKQDQWQVIVDGKGDGPDYGFEVKVVQVGPYTALQVIADRDLVPSGTLRLSISGPVEKQTGGKKISPEENLITRGLFLNGDQLVSIRPTKDKASLPDLPAPFRFRYREGNRLARIALPDGVAAGNARLTHHGQDLSWLPGESIVWLPERQNILSDRHAVIFLSSDPEAGSGEMTTRSAFSTLSPLSEEVAIDRSKLHRPRLVYERPVPMEIGDRFVQYRVSRGQTRDSFYPFEDRLSTPTVTATLTVVGLNTLAAFDPDHHARFSLGGILAGPDVAWNGRTIINHTIEVDLDTANYPGGAGQTLQFTHQVPIVPDGPNVDHQNLDAVHLEWKGYPRVRTDNTLYFEVPESADSLPRLVTVGGLPGGTTIEDVHLLDVTTPLAPTIITSPSLFLDQSGTIAVEWEVPASGGRYFVGLESSIGPPKSPMETVPLPNLPSGTLRGIYVTPPEFRESIMPLVDHRGPGYIILDPDTAYDIYAHGQESPDAIRDALAALIDAAPNRVEFPAVVLVGHGTFDRRDYLGLITAPQIPTYIDESVDTSVTIENCVDFPYGLLFGDDNFQDAQVARLPAMTTSELDHIVSRTITFESLAPALSEVPRPGLFVYDTDPGFLLDRPLWSGYWDQISRPLHEVLIDTGAGWPANRAALFEKLQEEPSGPALVMYIGHGNNNVWANSNFLHRVNVPDIDTRNGYPFVTTFTCLNSYYAFPGAGARSLAESWILAPMGRGASASYAPCSVDYYNAQKVKTEEFMKLIANPYRPSSIGGLVTRARIGFAVTRPELMITNREYLLFGDAGSPTTIPGISVNSVSDWMDF